MHKVELAIEIPERKLLKSLYQSLQAECKAPVDRSGRNIVTVRIVNKNLLISITSKNISNLRAVTNTYLYLIYAALSTLEAVNKY
ncbi:MAG: hypothetical protein DRO12_02130 [Thermoprotei archaeon]|nr:MAG: hypothetical protein DRO12_02130 [Thermoprotei archaeon]